MLLELTKLRYMYIRKRHLVISVPKINYLAYTGTEIKTDSRACNKTEKKDFLKIILSIIGQFDKILLLFEFFFTIGSFFCYSQIDRVTESH